MKNQCFLKYTIIRCHNDGSLQTLPIKKRIRCNDYKHAGKLEKELNQKNVMNLALNNVTELYANIEITYNQ